MRASPWIPHRAPSLKKQSHAKPASRDSIGTARPVIFGVVRHKKSEHLYDYNDQMTPPQLVGQLIETLFPKLLLAEDFSHVDDYCSSDHYKAKSALLFVFVRTLHRSNDLATDCSRVVLDEQNGYTLTKKLMKKVLKHQDKLIKICVDESLFDVGNRRLRDSVNVELMAVSDQWTKEQKEQMIL